MGQGRACDTGVSDTEIHTFIFAPQLNPGLISFPSFLRQVTFSEEDLPRDDCEYMLGYYSNNMNSIVGLSAPIQVRKVREQRKAISTLMIYS